MKNRYPGGRQMSETLLNAMFLTLSGGFQDAYTYCLRGHVFANAQTGNVVLMSAGLFQRNLSGSACYFISLCSFAMGIIAAELLRRRYKQMRKLHWRQLILAVEIILLFLVGFVPQTWNMAANSLVSFVCAMQVQSFRKFNGKSYASTMCIGNLRSGMEALCAYFYVKDRKVLRDALEYFAIILIFACGAGIGSFFSNRFGIRAIWISCLFLFAGFCIMVQTEQESKTM